jgi:hypothetical protein
MAIITSNSMREDSAAMEAPRRDEKGRRRNWGGPDGLKKRIHFILIFDWP